MLPSERYKEHLKMKAGEQKWREERDAVFRYRKRMTVLERKHGEVPRLEVQLPCGGHWDAPNHNFPSNGDVADTDRLGMPVSDSPT